MLLDIDEDEVFISKKKQNKIDLPFETHDSPKAFRDFSFDIQDLSLQLFSPALRAIKMETTSYLNVFEQTGDLSLEHFLDFDFDSPIVQPYVSGGQSDFVFLINFIRNHR